MESNRIVNRTAPVFQEIEGYSPRLYILNSKPPGPWAKVDPSTGEAEFWDLPAEAYSHGSMVGIQQQATDRTNYVKLYVYIDNPYDVTEPSELDRYYTWDYWKQVDLDWPKIDPNTGDPMDQFSNWPAA